MIWNGVPLGFTARGRPIDYNKMHDGSGNAATLIIGPPGSKKTVGLTATQLLDEPGKRSFVVIDPKGEMAAITANYRRKVCGKENVKIINPYGVLVDKRPDLRSDCWNPYGDLDPAALGYGDDCAAKCDALVKPDSNEHQKHFPDSARSGMTGVTMYVVKDALAQNPPMAPSLPSVRAVLTQEPAALKKSIKRMLACGDFDITSRLAKFLADNDEISGIRSTIETNTAWLTKPMRDDMATAAGGDFRDCSKRPTTIYVILPTQELDNKAVYLRLMLASALRALYREDGVPTTLLVEEGFVIGHHDEIEKSLSILRGFNSRVTIVFQSLQQIKKLYPATWGLFMAGAVLSFRPADLETARELSARAGEEIVPSLSASDPSSPGDLGVRPTWGPQKRERIPVGKMFAMPQGRALVWLPHQETPQISYVKGYYEIPKLRARADPNPYFKGGSKGAKLRNKIAAGVLVGGVIGGGVALWSHELPSAVQEQPIAAPANVGGAYHHHKLTGTAHGRKHGSVGAAGFARIGR